MAAGGDRGVKPECRPKQVWRCENLYCRVVLGVQLWRLAKEVEATDVRLGDCMVRVRCPICGRENAWVGGGAEVT